MVSRTIGLLTQLVPGAWDSDSHAIVPVASPSVHFMVVSPVLVSAPSRLLTQKVGERGVRTINSEGRGVEMTKKQGRERSREISIATRRTRALKAFRGS